VAGRDLYAVLGIDAGADLPTIKRAYRRLVFSIHPDVGAAPDRKRYLEIHEAYEILTDSGGAPFGNEGASGADLPPASAESAE